MPVVECWTYAVEIGGITYYLSRKAPLSGLLLNKLVDAIDEGGTFDSIRWFIKEYGLTASMDMEGMKVVEEYSFDGNELEKVI